MTTVKTRHKIGALAAAAVTAGLPALAAAPAGAAVYNGDYTSSNVHACAQIPSASQIDVTRTFSKVNQYTGEKITVTAKHWNGCVSYRLEVPDYMSAANTPMYFASNTTSTANLFRVQGFPGAGGSSKQLSNGRSYYDTGWVSRTYVTGVADTGSFQAYTPWGVLAAY